VKEAGASRPPWLLGAAVVSCLLGAAAPGGARADVAIDCGSGGAAYQVCRGNAEAWGRQTGHAVRVISTPKASNETLALYQQLLSARSAAIDVLRVDTVWTGILGTNFVDLSAHVDRAALDGHFPLLVENNTVGGRLVAMPWFVDVGLLYYRKDLLERYGRAVPRTWRELTETARIIQEAERRAGRERLWGYVFQGRAYEGLTCNALEWVHSFGGGTVIDAEGRVTVDNPRAAAALTLAASWVGTIAPRGVLNYGEEEARGVFQSGNAVFMRNWPYAWAVADGEGSAVRGRVGVAALPKGDPEGTHTGALGGWHLAVSRYSRTVGPAVDLVLHMAGVPVQRQNALVAGLNPTLRPLYADPEVLSASPVRGRLLETLADAVARPSRAAGRRYNQVSTEFWTAVHDTLAGRGSAEENLRELGRRLERLARRAGW
jgi:trehalose/maltose transport system substrate-binding protein